MKITILTVQVARDCGIKSLRDIEIEYFLNTASINCKIMKICFKLFICYIRNLNNTFKMWGFRYKQSRLYYNFFLEIILVYLNYWHSQNQFIMHKILINEKLVHIKGKKSYAARQFRCQFHLPFVIPNWILI